MGLDQFRDDNTSSQTTTDNQTRKVYSYDKQSILNEIRRYKEEHDRINKEAFHRDSDYPSVTTVRKYFDTWNDALEKATGELNQQHRYKLAEWEIYLDILKAADKHGIHFTASELDNDESLISQPLVKQITGKRFNEVKKKLSLPVNAVRDVKKEEVVDELNQLNCKLTAENIDNNCSFSSGIVRRYGDGSMHEGLINLGFEPSEKQEILSNSQTTINNNPSPSLEKREDYDKDADGYIYILKLVDKQESEWYYVGQISEDSSLKLRLSQHFRNKGHFNTNTDLEFTEIELDSIYNMYKSKRYSSEFKEKVNDKERELSYAVAIKHKTTNIMGGH